MLRPLQYMRQMPRRTIDITPGAGLRRAGRVLLDAALLMVMLPLLWLIGGLVLLAVFGATAVVLTALATRQLWRGRQANNGRVDTMKRR